MFCLDHIPTAHSGPRMFMDYFYGFVMDI